MYAINNRALPKSTVAIERFLRAGRLNTAKQSNEFQGFYYAYDSHQYALKVDFTRQAFLKSTYIFLNTNGYITRYFLPQPTAFPFSYESTLLLIDILSPVL